MLMIFILFGEVHMLLVGPREIASPKHLAALNSGKT